MVKELFNSLSISRTSKNIYSTIHGSFPLGEEYKAEHGTVLFFISSPSCVICIYNVRWIFNVARAVCVQSVFNFLA